MTCHYISLWSCGRACVCEHRALWIWNALHCDDDSALVLQNTLMSEGARESHADSSPFSPPCTHLPAVQGDQRFLPVASHHNPPPPPPPTSLFIYFHICVPSPTQAISVTGNLFPPASSNSLIIVLFKKLINVGELMQDHEREAKHRAMLQTFRSWLRQGQLFISCSCIAAVWHPRSLTCC